MGNNVARSVDSDEELVFEPIDVTVVELLLSRADPTMGSLDGPMGDERTLKSLDLQHFQLQPRHVACVSGWGKNLQDEFTSAREKKAKTCTRADLGKWDAMIT